MCYHVRLDMPGWSAKLEHTRFSNPQWQQSVAVDEIDARDSLRTWTRASWSIGDSHMHVYLYLYHAVGSEPIVLERRPGALIIKTRTHIRRVGRNIRNIHQRIKGERKYGPKTREMNNGTLQIQEKHTGAKETNSSLNGPRPVRSCYRSQ